MAIHVGVESSYTIATTIRTITPPMARIGRIAAWAITDGRTLAADNFTPSSPLI